MYIYFPWLINVTTTKASSKNYKIKKFRSVIIIKLILLNRCDLYRFIGLHEKIMLAAQVTSVYSYYYYTS